LQYAIKNLTRHFRGFKLVHVNCFQNIFTFQDFHTSMCRVIAWNCYFNSLKRLDSGIISKRAEHVIGRKHYNSVLEITRPRSFISGNTELRTDPSFAVCAIKNPTRHFRGFKLINGLKTSFTFQDFHTSVCGLSHGIAFPIFLKRLDSGMSSLLKEYTAFRYINQ
jgi:hypothetical protein